VEEGGQEEVEAGVALVGQDVAAGVIIVMTIFSRSSWATLSSSWYSAAMGAANIIIRHADDDGGATGGECDHCRELGRRGHYSVLADASNMICDVRVTLGVW
jgi:hypothetical protein